MMKNRLFALLSIIGGPFVIVALLTYIFFPFLNEEKYKEVTKPQQPKIVNKNIPLNIGRDYETIREQVKFFRRDNDRLEGVIDSLELLNEQLSSKVDSLESIEPKGRNSQADRQRLADELAKIASEEHNDNLAENVNSILSMEVENLSPILNQMTEDQLLLMYNEASGLQKKKLLRSLDSDNAAKLIERIIL